MYIIFPGATTICTGIFTDILFKFCDEFLVKLRYYISFQIPILIFLTCNRLGRAASVGLELINLLQAIQWKTLSPSFSFSLSNNFKFHYLLNSFTQSNLVTYFDTIGSRLCSLISSNPSTLHLQGCFASRSSRLRRHVTSACLLFYCEILLFFSIKSLHVFVLLNFSSEWLFIFVK
jgi:hypothetical protein